MQIGFFSILTIIFVIAKLAGVIAWSWWLVLLPAIIGLGVGAVVLVFALFVLIVSALK